MDKWEDEKEEIKKLALAIKGCTKEEFAANMVNLENYIFKTYRSGNKSMIIKEDWFVYQVNSECEKPYITVCPSNDMEEEKILMPEQLSHYLKTHFCGSHRMHDNLIERGGQAVKNQIKNILGVKND